MFYNLIMNTGDKNLGMRLQEERLKKKWSQEDLAEKAGVGYSTVVKIENGINFGRKDTHQKLAKALGISVSKLVYGNEPLTENAEDEPPIIYAARADGHLSEDDLEMIDLIVKKAYKRAADNMRPKRKE